MSGVALYGLDVAAAQLKLVRGAERPERMEHDLVEAVFADKAPEPLVNDPGLQRPAVVLCEHKVIVVVESVTGLNMRLLTLPVLQ